VNDGVVAAAAAQAPPGPGVYFFLGDDLTLLYVGKAGDLRQRLYQHARPADGRRLDTLYGAVREIRWEPLPDEPAAAAREADLIVALRPAFNAAVVGDARWAYVVVESALSGDGVTLTVTPQPGRDGRRYGCFPHLGRGVSTRPGIACSEGYAALARLLWAAGGPGGERDAVPAAIAGPSPPDRLVVDVPAPQRRGLHDLLSGNKDRLVPTLLAGAAARRSPVLLPALQRDAAAALAFYDAGPRALRELRRRHSLPAGPVDRATIEAALAAEVRAAIGDFRLPATTDPTAGLLGPRESRTRTLRAMVRRFRGREDTP
jgi:hypothetical protein